MASGGFYLMHRGWQDHPVFRAEEFSRRDAFVWMIEEASFRERRVAMPKGEVILARGQLSHSLRFMAKAWKWDEARVRRFIASLSNAKIIDASTDAGQTIVTVCNYDKYQAFEAAPDAATDAGATQHRRSTDANEKEGNKGKKVIEDGANAPSRAQRGSRLPEGWRPQTLNRETVSGEIAQHRGQDWMRRTFEGFELHWRAESGKTATKSDWQAAWAKWVIEQDRRDGRNGHSQGNGRVHGGRQLSTTERAARGFLADFGELDEPRTMQQARVRDGVDALPHAGGGSRDAGGGSQDVAPRRLPRP